MQVRSLGQEDPLEEGMATRSSVLAWRIPWTEEPGGLQSIRLLRVRYTHTQHTSTRKIFKNSFFFLQLGKNQEQTFHLLIPNKDLNMKRSLKKTAEPNVIRYPGWDSETGVGG